MYQQGAGQEVDRTCMALWYGDASVTGSNITHSTTVLTPSLKSPLGLQKKLFNLWKSKFNSPVTVVPLLQSKVSIIKIWLYENFYFLSFLTKLNSLNTYWQPTVYQPQCYTGKQATNKSQNYTTLFLKFQITSLINTEMINLTLATVC